MARHVNQRSQGHSRALRPTIRALWRTTGQRGLPTRPAKRRRDRNGNHHDLGRQRGSDLWWQRRRSV